MAGVFRKHWSVYEGVTTAFMREWQGCLWGSDDRVYGRVTMTFRGKWRWRLRKRKCEFGELWILWNSCARARYFKLNFRKWRSNRSFSELGMRKDAVERVQRSNLFELCRAWASSAKPIRNGICQLSIVNCQLSIKQTSITSSAAITPITP